MNDRMDGKIRSALDQVRAGDELKSRTLELVRDGIQAREALPKRRQGLRLALAMCALLLVVGVLGGWLYLSPVSAINIDVNPSLELAVNRFDRVIGINGSNAAGRELAESINVRNMDYASAVELIVSDERMLGYIAEGRDVSIVVVCGDQEKEQRMLTALEDCVGQRQNVHCHAGANSGNHHDQGEHHGGHGSSSSAASGSTTPTPNPATSASSCESGDNDNGQEQHRYQGGGEVHGQGNGHQYGKHKS